MRRASHIFARVFASVCLCILWSCKEEKHLFELRSGSETGILFENTLSYTEAFNPYTYRNFYNGGGVALGDINNDGLVDIYFTGNLVSNALYLNKGNFQFEDITKKAGVACEGVWSSGATFVDINQDGLLDIYVSKSGMPGGENRHNELFINQGDNTFKEASKSYGLDITGLSVQAAFFDYDRDGDLDCYLLNNSMRSVGAYDLIENQRLIPDPDGNRLLENQDGYFVNVSEKAGIYSSKIGFGLGITLSDFNNDQWPDLFISNDFFEKDYLYINQQDGSFKEEGDHYFNALSMGSMGADAADIDNDLRTDLMVTEMLPENLERKKLKTAYENWDKHQLAFEKGYGKQLPRNVLQRNMGSIGFAEIGRSTGIEGSEWSWAALFFDMDNDGLKDLYISNGIHKDLLDRDYLSFMANDEKVRQLIEEDEEVLSKLIDVLPSAAVPNAAFQNTGAFTFKNVRDPWGFNTPSFSNGSAYGDLDNDGDLDLVVNNINNQAFVYENNAASQGNNYLSIGLKGSEKNTFAIGAKVIGYFKDSHILVEQFPSRGFQSAISHRLHMGLGKHTKLDSVEIYWPRGTKSVLYDVASNQHIVIEELNTIVSRHKQQRTEAARTEDLAQSKKPDLQFKHLENNYIDFNNERLLPQMFSNEGPVIESGDLNGDGVEDFFFGGAKNQASEIWLSNASNNTYKKTNEKLLQTDAVSEDTEALFLDVDGDSDLDIYIGSGGKAFSKFSFNLHDRIYINNGQGGFTKGITPAFKRPISTGALVKLDVNKDGRIDLFVGERYRVETYGLEGNGHILINEGGGNFKVSTPISFQNLGMITDAKAIDLNKDGWEDLIVVGEWMGVRVFLNERGTFKEATETYGLQKTSGIWSSLEVKDLNGDGFADLVIGNTGTNSFYKAHMKLYVGDYDLNGSMEQIYTQEFQGKDYPIVDKDELTKQIPSLKKDFLYYKDYAKASFEDIFKNKNIQNQTVKTLDITESSIFWGSQDGFKREALAAEIQYSNVSAILSEDVNKDGYPDVILGGNQSRVKPQFGATESSMGWLLINKKNGIFEPPRSLEIKGEIRDFSILKEKNESFLIIGINNDSIQIKKLH
ncbi:MAG: VCBS repeat-containing protein [Flavobacteriaceae bacterium]|nr:VCBS repeat-containing protein [Flavobacteriaceae bacterium]MCI5088091.1 VCBS repeat-containing protein [Flavobacteriaceae bacterium]